MVLRPRTLRGRLTLAYAAALIVALAAFATVALLELDSTQRHALDAQLATTAHAAAAVVDVAGGTLQIDPTDRTQFGTIAGGRAASAIFRADGTLAFSSVSAVPAAIGARALGATRETYGTVDVAGDRVRVFTLPIRGGTQTAGAVAVWRDVEQIDALDRSIALAFALAIPVVVALATLAGGAIAGRGLQPLHRIATLASEIEAQDLSRRLALPPTRDELGRLAATFDRMLDRLQHAFDRERRFTSDASHELRAPLSVIRAEADVALRRDREPVEYRRALETIVTEADALEALTRELLAAARADAAPADAVATVDLAALAGDAARRLGPLAVPRDITLRQRLDGDALVAGVASELERAIVTVLHNALKYAREHGTVTIAVVRARDAVELCVTDDGPGFSPEAREHAFDRFWRDDEARAQSGSGLGLAIAKAIVERYRGTIELANGATGGALVRMRFPADLSASSRPPMNR